VEGAELGNELGEKDGCEDGEMIGERLGEAEGRSVGFELMEGAAVGLKDFVGGIVGDLVRRPSCVTTTGPMLDKVEK